MNTVEQNASWGALNAMARELAPTLGGYAAGFREACRRLPEAASKIGEAASTHNGGHDSPAVTGTALPWREVFKRLGVESRTENSTQRITGCR